ncbi:MAG: YihY/virulence factor BrkB family protein [Acidimicrobiales bacterium]
MVSENGGLTSQLERAMRRHLGRPADDDASGSVQPQTGEERRRVRLRTVPLREWPLLLWRVVKESARDRITMIAASLAFHGFLALLPILIALVGMVSLVGLSAATLHQLLHDTNVLLPAQMSEILNQQLIRPPSKQTSLTELILGIAVALWSSIEAMSALEIALDMAYEVPRDRGFLKRRVLALPLIGITLVLGGAASVLLVLGGPLARLLPSAVALVKPEYHALLLLVRYGGALLLLMILLSALYSFGTAGGSSTWDWVSPGSIVAALGWLLTAVGFSFYLDHFGHETRNYGSLAGVAVTLLWMFLTSVAVLFGAEFNRELERVAAAKAKKRDPLLPHP